MKIRSPLIDQTPRLIPPPRPFWFLGIACAVAALGFGVLGFLTEHHHGTIVTGMRATGHGGAAWGLYIVFVVYFIGLSFAGITVAALARLFKISILDPVTRIAELLTLTCLLAGATCVIADLGRPDQGLLKLPKYANPSSPFFGTFTMVVSGYLFSSLVFFFLSGRRDAWAASLESKGLLKMFHQLWASGYKDAPLQQRRHYKTSFWLALGILPLLLTAHSTLGFVFGIQGGRPGWFSALQAPGFVMLAAVSGTGGLIILTVFYRWLFRLHGRIPDASIQWLGNFMWVLSLVYMYFMIVDELTASYAAPEAERHMAHQIVAGRFAPLFWTTVVGLFGTFLIPFLLYLRNKKSIPLLIVASVMANIAAVCKRILIVIPSQIEGVLTPIEPGSYFPTWVELAVVTGLFGFVVMGLLVFGRIFPLVPSHPHVDPDSIKPPKDTRRMAGTIFAAVIAVTLIFVGLTDSFRLWSHGELDPRIPFAPVIYANGVMFLFIAAIVYELVPDPIIKIWGEAKGHVVGIAKSMMPEVRMSHPGDVAKRLERLAAAAETAFRNGDKAACVENLQEIQRVASAERNRQHAVEEDVEGHGDHGDAHGEPSDGHGEHA